MSTGQLLLILIFAIPICGIVFSSLEKIARVQVLEGEMDGVRQRLAETLERLDFAERLLARSDPAKVPEPRAGP